MRRSAHPFDDAKTRAVAWLTAWDSQGAHRTPTTGDEAGALWLAHEVARLGVEVAAAAGPHKPFRGAALQSDAKELRASSSANWSCHRVLVSSGQ